MAAGSRASAPLAARSGAVASLLFAVLGIGVAALDLPATSVPSYTNSFAYARWSIAIGAALFTLALPWASRNLRMPGFEALGRESFGIFVFNPLILGIFAWQLGRATTVTESLLRTGATVAIAFPLTRALRKRLPIAFP
jgi:peptidoglycan/LPS O-acetylase OafA/YrhL